MNNAIIRIPPTFISEGMVIRKVWKIILRLLALFINLNTLMILNVLRIDVAVPIDVKMDA